MRIGARIGREHMACFRNTLLLVALFGLAPIARAVTVAFPPTTDTNPVNCQTVAAIQPGADGGFVWFYYGDFFMRNGTEFFGTCTNNLGVGFNPMATGISISIYSFTATSNIVVLSAGGSTSYQISYGNTITVSIPGPTSGVSITTTDNLSAVAITGVNVGSQIVNTLPGDIQFDITDATPANDRRVLLSNAHLLHGTNTPQFDYPYYQNLLRKDRAIAVNLRTLYGNVGRADIPVTLRIIDPPDPSEYIVGGPNWQGQPVPGAVLSHTGDNHGPSAIFHGNCVPWSTYQVTSGTNGAIQVELDLDPATAAGDNYQVEATATFPNGTTKTVRSGTITAWKRLFVDKKPMFRRGAPLATDAPAGVTNLIVHKGIISSTGDVFHQNDQLCLLHAPQYGQPKTANSFYQDFVQVAGRPQPFTAAAPAAGPGAIETNGTVTVIGHHAHFNSLNSGDVISIGQEDRYIITVTTSQGTESLTVDRPFTFVGIAGDRQPQGYTVGDPNLVDHGRHAYVRLSLTTALPRPYQTEALLQQPGVLTLNDAVEVVSAVTLPPAPADYYASSDDLLIGGVESQPAKVFPSAYTEYIVLPWQPTAAPGGVVPRAVLQSDEATQWFVDKWFALPAPQPVPSTDPNPMYQFHYVTRPNHQLLLVGDTSSTDQLRSQTDRPNGFLSFSVRGELSSVLNRGNLEYNVSGADDRSPLNGADVETVLKRTAVHELTHQWKVNGGPASSTLDHCFKEVSYTSGMAYPTAPTLPALPAGLEFCLMTKANVGPTMPAPWNSSVSIEMVQYCYRFGLTHYHFVQSAGQWDSEYLAIRNRPDPWTP